MRREAARSLSVPFPAAILPANRSPPPHPALRPRHTDTYGHTYIHAQTHARTPAALVPDPHFASVLSAALVTASAAGRLLEDLPVDGVGFVLV